MGLYLEEDEKKDYLKCLAKFPQALNEKIIRKTQSKKHSDFMSLYNSITKKIGTSTQLYKQLEKLKQMKHLLARLLESYIYMRVGNHSRAEQVIKDFISNDFFLNLYSSESLHLSRSAKYDILIYLIKSFEEDLKSEKLVSSLIFYLYHQSTGAFKERLDDEFEIPHSLREVRSFYRSNRYGKVFPFVWGPSIFEDSSQKEYMNYIGNTNIFESLKKGQGQNLLFYRTMSNIPKNQHKVILDKLLDMKKSGQAIEQFIFWELVNDDTFYKFVTAHSKIQVGIVTNGKRRFYQQLLAENKLPAFAIWGLLSLGDFQKKYLIQLKTLQDGI